MDIFSFGVHFTDEQSCRLHFKEQRDVQGVFVIDVKVPITIGLRTTGVINVKVAKQEYLCVAVLLWRVRNCPS